MAASAGETRNLRRWRVLLTVGAWLLIVQSGTGLLFGLLALGLYSSFSTDSLLGGLSSLLDSTSSLALDRLLDQLTLLNRIAVVANGLLLAGSVGLLRRRRWGWYIVTLLHLLGAVAAVVWGSTLLLPVLSLLDPDRAGSLSLILALLIALVPASVLAILLLKPITDQFEPSPPAGN